MPRWHTGTGTANKHLKQKELTIIARIDNNDKEESNTSILILSMPETVCSFTFKGSHNSPRSHVCVDLRRLCKRMTFIYDSSFP